ncbi:MAG: glycosyltransferase family 4 protein [Anaerolineales bacterium]
MIGIDYTAAYEQGAGIGRLVRQLVSELAQVDTDTRYKLLVAGATHADLPPAPGDNFQWKPTRVTPLWFSRVWYRARVPYPLELFVGPVKLYHSPNFELPPHLPATRTLLTVHDLSYVRTPETSPPVLKHYLDRVVPWSVARADHVLADSQATKDDLIDLYDTPPDKITVLLSGVDARFQPMTDTARLAAVRQRYDIPAGDYIFAIGTVQPRKNYARLVRAVHHLGPSFQDMCLVIAGGKGWLEDEIYHTLDELHMHGRVRFIGYAADDDLPALYSGAMLTAYPSLYEGFGFPILESMACGTPVITGNVSSMPEVAGDAALIVDPYDVEALADGLRRLITDTGLRASLVRKGTARAAEFTWRRAAQELKTIYDRMLENR